MNRNRVFMLFVVTILLVFALTACDFPPTKSKRTPVPATPTGQGGTGAQVTSSNPTQVMEQINAFATQTAMASGQSEVVVPTEAPALPTAAPVNPTPVVSIVQATPTAIFVPAPTPGVPATYALQRGEFPFCLARRYNVDIGELLRLNGLGPNSLVQTGTVLKMPQSGQSFAGQRALRPHPATYTARAGDTIFSVACYYGDVDPYGIAAANQITSPYNLTAGQLLNIP